MKTEKVVNRLTSLSNGIWLSDLPEQIVNNIIFTYLHILNEFEWHQEIQACIPELLYFAVNGRKSSHSLMR